MMAAAELYAFWKIAERIGMDAFIVRRCLKRLERDELTIRAATEVLWSYATLAIRTYGSLEELAQLTHARAQQGDPELSSECEVDQRLDGDIVRPSAASPKSAAEMSESNPVPPSRRHIVTATYRGPDRRRRQREINPNPLLDRERRRSDSQSLWSMFLDTRRQESDDC